jgi:hypothetical protein
LTNGPTVIIAIAAVIVAALGALIAYFQFITAGRKLMLDLFDQRLKVVEGIERALGSFSITGNITRDNFRDLLLAKSAARFLFEDDVQQSLNRVASAKPAGQLIRRGRLRSGRRRKVG